MSSPNLNSPNEIYEAVREVMRLKHLSYRTEQTCLIRTPQIYPLAWQTADRENSNPSFGNRNRVPHDE